MNETRISEQSLLRVLKGVAVATKTPEALVEELTRVVKRDNIAFDVKDTASRIAALQREIQQTQKRIEALQADSDDDRVEAHQEQYLDVAKNEYLTLDEWREVVRKDPTSANGPLKHLSHIVLAVALLRERLRSGAEAKADELDDIWSLVYEAIIGADGSEVKFGVSRSAQGCLTVALCSLVTDGKIEELWRFHIWLPDGERGLPDVSVHSHQCFGRSWILLGHGTDVVWNSEDTEDYAEATHAKYKLHWANADGSANGPKFTTHQTSSTIRNSGKLLRLAVDSKATHSRDMSYTIPCNTYHQSIVPAGRLHSTLFVFESSRGYFADAAVLGPKDGTEYTQIREVPGITAAGLAEMVDATRRWEQAYGKEKEGDVEDPIVLAYYRLSRAMSLLRAGQSQEALEWIHPQTGEDPIQTLKNSPSARHEEYIRQFVGVGGEDVISGRRNDLGALSPAINGRDIEAEA